MNKFMVFIAVIVLALTASFAAGPFWTIHRIEQAVSQQDTMQLSGYIDYPVLRENIKQQLKAVMSAKVANEVKSNPFAALAADLTVKLGDGIVDALVEYTITPAGMAQLMRAQTQLATTGSPSHTTPTQAGQPATQQSTSIADSTKRNKPVKLSKTKDVHWAFDTPSHFSVWWTTDKNEEVRFVLTRKGFKWWLSNIVLPPDNSLLPR